MIPCYGGVGSRGDPCDVMIIGWCPGIEEITQQKPFVGPAGSVLNSLLETLYPRSVYFTNYLCKDDCVNGHAHLNAAINECRPKLIIGLGDDVNHIFSSRSLTDNRGQPFFQDGRWVMIMNQPAAVLHLRNESPDKAQDIFCDLVRDLSKIDNILSWNPPQSTIKYRLVTELDEAQEALDNLDELVALDIETKSSSVEQDDAFWDALDCYCVYDGTIPIVLTGAALEARLPDRRWLFHNGLFDTSCLKRFINQTLSIHEDTMLMSYALDERPGHHGLKNLAREYLGAGRWEEGKGTNVHMYNAFDAFYTFNLYYFFNPRLIEDDVASLYRDVLIPGMNMYRDAYVGGLNVDQHILGEIMLQFIPRMERQRKSLVKAAQEMGWEGEINLNSGPQIGKLLFEIVGLRSTKQTATGRYSTAAAELEKIDHPFIADLIDHKHLVKMVNTYGVGIYEKIKIDGLLHPLPGLHRTKTGRAAYTDPAIQTIPQDYSVGELAILRKMYVPGDPDYVLMEADHSQIEIWMGAALSGDEHMLADLSDPFMGGPPNWHSRIAVEMLGADPFGAKTDWSIARFTSKKVTFGVMYLIGAASLAKPKTGINSTTRIAQTYIDKWYAKYSQFKRWQQSVIKEAYEIGELQTPFGNKMRLHHVVSSRLEPAIANFKIQGTASHWTLASAIELNHMLHKFDSRILLLVHDSIVMRVPYCFVTEVAALVKAIMEKPKLQGFPSVPVEIKVGQNWFETERVA